ncbi:MAG: 3'-5' exonuclease [Gammaproteobacteria bacterium]|nr:MAG: 3'-5' exonuclease [Gammaproteobacteria bacterium]
MNILVFDIETIPDLEGGRRLFGLEGLGDEEVASAMFALRRQETGGQSEFIRHHLQRVVAISAVLRQGEKLAVWSLGERDSTEAELVQRFFDGIERYSPVLVSWNGSGFDLPVLHYRALLHGISAPRYWEVGDEERAFRYNNYLGRYHWRHIDLMDVLAGFSPRASAPLDQIAQLLGFPGKVGMSGGDVWNRWLAGEIDAIRDYCETDVLNTYLVYLRFERMRGNLEEGAYRGECERLRGHLREVDRPHFREFLEAWPEAI